MKHIILLLFTLCSSQAFGYYVEEQNYSSGLFVVNGEKSTEKSIHAKHVVMFNGISSCSGTIISDKAILTAAHCENSFETIHFGMGEITKPVSDSVIHEDYNMKERFSPDLAIVFFEGGLPEGFEPMPLLEDSSLIQNGQEVFVAGFGQDLARNYGILKHFESILVNELAEEHKVLIIDNNEMGSACFGDSGGTSYVLIDNKPVLVGVNSVIGPENKGVHCFTEFLVSVDVSSFIDWIEEKSK